MLCQKCSGIHFRPLEQAAADRPRRLVDRELHPDLIQLYYLHHENLRVLQEAVAEGCHLCYKILSGMRIDTTGVGCEADDFDDSGVLIWRYHRCESLISTDSGVWNKRWDMEIHFLGRVLYPYIFDLWESPIAEILHAFSNRIIPSPADPRALHDLSSASETPDYIDIRGYGTTPLLANVHSSEPDTSTISPANLALASGWLQVCEKSHQPCREYQIHGYCPNLLTNVREPRSPKLIRSNNDAGAYAYVTLSYKWGKCIESVDSGERINGKLKNYCTTSSNVKRRQMDGIPLQELPRTIRDAIYVSSALGFQWLWIDALCIVQDDPEKESEVDDMGLIYRGSTLTLFALAGGDADAGLSASRDPRGVRPCQLKLNTTWNGSTREEEVYLNIWGVDNGNEPLLARGWVLQEQILATRGLYFGEKHISWRCPCGHTSELDPRLQRDIKKLTSTDREIPEWEDQRKAMIDEFQPLRACLLNPYETEERRNWQSNVKKSSGGSFIDYSEQMNHFDLWYSLISRYSSRHLSYDNDALPAVAGLANAIARVRKCDYIQGLWIEDLHNGLVWYVIDGGRDADPLKDAAFDDELAKPSWTWASQWGKQIYFSGHSSLPVDAHRVRASWDGPHRTRRGPDANLSWEITSLEFTGKVKSAIVDSGKNGNCVLLCAETREPVGTLISDQTGIAVGTAVHCLLCNAYWDKIGGERLVFNCLVLRPLNFARKEYVRIGFVRIEKSDWFGPVEESSGCDWDLKQDKTFEETIWLF